jgi:hypothetical protein
MSDLAPSDVRHGWHRGIPQRAGWNLAATWKVLSVTVFSSHITGGKHAVQWLRSVCVDAKHSNVTEDVRLQQSHFLCQQG